DLSPDRQLGLQFRHKIGIFCRNGEGDGRVHGIGSCRFPPLATSALTLQTVTFCYGSARWCDFLQKSVTELNWRSAPAQPRAPPPRHTPRHAAHCAHAADRPELDRAADSAAPSAAR